MAKSLRNSYLLFIFLLSSFCLLVHATESDSDIAVDSRSDCGEEEDVIIERNPQYETDDEDMEDSKGDVNRAMSRSNKGKSPSVHLLKKHRRHITIALIFFAFRREIGGCMRSLLFSTGPNGEKKVRRIPLSPMTVLKILVFIDVLKKIQSVSHDGHSSSTPTTSFFSGRLLSLFHEVNPAYLPPVEQHYTFERINDRYKKDRMAYQKAISDQQASLKVVLAEARKKRTTPHGCKKSEKKQDNTVGSKFLPVCTTSDNSTVIVLDLTPLDSSVSQIDIIRDEVSFVLYNHRANREYAKSKVNTTASDENVTLPELEVIVLLESPGGSASDYGLGASQMSRLRDEPGITLTVCVDKVAASGGYMMACVAHRLCCAHFAVVGSIGVIGQALNIHNTLQNWGVRPLVFRGGKDKAPVGVIGEVTKEGIAKVQSMVDKTHDAFKRHVVRARPGMAKSIDSVATGDVYLGCDALKMGLVDRLITSDEYIGEKVMAGAKVLKLIRNTRRSLHFFGSTPGRRGPFAQSATYFPGVFSKITGIVDDFCGERGQQIRLVRS